ncbi:MAG: universal stress protein [Aeromicrobium sp.]
MSDPPAAEPAVVVGVVRRETAALRFALAEAARRDVVLRVVHAIWLPVQHRTDDTGGRLRARGQAVLDAARRFVESSPDARPQVEYVLSTRPPITTLLEESQMASCLVLGADELPWYDRLLGGEVATYVARHARCVVVTVPERPHAQHANGDVVVALDPDTATSPTLDQAFEQAEARRCGLRVLHAVGRNASRVRIEASRESVDRLVAERRTAHPGVRILADVVADDADEACLRASEHAEILVIGRPRRPELATLLARPIAMRVLRTARCPVLVANDAPVTS